MSVPKKRKTSSKRGMRQSHHALKSKNLTTSGKEAVPHAFKKALDLNKKLKTN